MDLKHVRIGGLHASAGRMNEDISDLDDVGDFVGLLTQGQSSLHAYICLLTGNSSAAQDILQETNRILWKLRAQYDPAREFLPWARAIAYNQVRAARSTSTRERLIFQQDETLEALANEQVDWQPNTSARLMALESCLGKLAHDQRLLIEGHYRDGHPMDTLAAMLKLRTNTIAVRLHRVRKALAECIERAM